MLALGLKRRTDKQQHGSNFKLAATSGLSDVFRRFFMGSNSSNVGNSQEMKSLTLIASSLPAPTLVGSRPQIVYDDYDSRGMDIQFDLGSHGKIRIFPAPKHQPCLKQVYSHQEAKEFFERIIWNVTRSQAERFGAMWVLPEKVDPDCVVIEIPQEEDAEPEQVHNEDANREKPEQAESVQPEQKAIVDLIIHILVLASCETFQHRYIKDRLGCELCMSDVISMKLKNPEAMTEDNQQEKTKKEMELKNPEAMTEDNQQEKTKKLMADLLSLFEPDAADEAI